MADEELEKEAEEYAKECFPNDEFKQAMVEDGCLKFYTQGKETAIKSIDDICTALNKQNIQKFAELEEESTELEVQNKELQARLDLSEENVMRQQEVIEKMKCCSNCEHYRFYNQITGYSCAKDTCNTAHSEWELKKCLK